MNESLNFNNFVLSLIYNKNNDISEELKLATHIDKELQLYYQSLGGSLFECNLFISVKSFTEEDFIQTKCFNRLINYSKINSWIELYHLHTGNVIRLFIYKDNSVVASAFYTNCNIENNKCKNKITEEFIGHTTRSSFITSITITNFHNFLFNGEFYEDQKPYHKYH